MGFVLVPHLDPSHHSLLTDLLSRATKLSIEEVKNGRAVEPNHIYVIPPNTYMVIERGVLKLTPRKKFGGQPMPIDFFLRSLAEDRAEMAIGIILSGSASDGALGIEAIKSSGGMTFAQDEQTARYPGMPHSAVATGRVDFVLPPAQIAAELARIAVRPLVGLPAPMEPAESFFPKSGTALATLFKLLKARTGVDFSLYKEMTIKRRTWRRMTPSRSFCSAVISRPPS